MDNQQILTSIKEVIDKIGMDSVILPESDAALPRLIIYTGSENNLRSSHMDITAQVLDMGQELSKDPEEKAKEYVRIQLDSEFPFKVADSSLADVAQFLHILNLQLELPGFYLNYFNNVIVYRFTLLAEQNYLPLKLLFGVIGMVMMFQDIYSKSLERLATGKVSFTDLLGEIHEALKKKG